MKVAVVIPCYRVHNHILNVLARLGPEIDQIYVVDDACPQNSGKHVAEHCRDRRVKVLFHAVNQGVGGAMLTGYRAAIAGGAEIVVKMDGDDQMDSSLVPALVRPITEGRADYVKGNRFFTLDSVAGMPPIRVFGNSVLSFVNKVTSGYWNLMDPTNGFTAIHARILELLPLDKIDKRYFFESDMLFRLNTVRAVVAEIPMAARYGEEASSLKVSGVIREFPGKYAVRFFKRIFYNYYLRDFNACSIQLVLGLCAIIFGGVFGFWHWYWSAVQGISTPTGTVMLAALPVILGFQLLLAAINFDVMNVPRDPLHRLLSGGQGLELRDRPRAVVGL